MVRIKGWRKIKGKSTVYGTYSSPTDVIAYITNQTKGSRSEIYISKYSKWIEKNGVFVRKPLWLVSIFSIPKINDFIMAYPKEKRIISKLFNENSSKRLKCQKIYGTH